MSTFLDFLEQFATAPWVEPVANFLRIFAIVLGAWLLIRTLERSISSFRLRLVARMEDVNTVQRADTLGRVFRYIITLAVSALAILLVLSQVGVSLAPLIGASGVIGIAIGFGAQSLVKDYFSGFFILLEDQIRQGDVVKVGDFAGFVEDVTLRHVRLRDYNGNVHFVPNNLITAVTNMTRGFSMALMDIRVNYGADLNQVFALLREISSALREDAVLGPKILADIEIAGVENWDITGLMIRCRIKTLPLGQWEVRRAYLRRLKEAFEEHGIEFPGHQLTLFVNGDPAHPQAPIPLEWQRVAQARAGEC